MKLRGLDGSHLFGFLATFGLLRLLHRAARPNASPRLRFDKDYCAIIEGVPSLEFVEGVARAGLHQLHMRLKTDFASIDRPRDLTVAFIDKLSQDADTWTCEELAGMGCCIGDRAYESTLCAANGAGHQNLVLSMRDVLSLVEAHPEALTAAIVRPWDRAFETPQDDRRRFSLGNRKPTLRLDPSDERLYALRFDDPTSDAAPYRTELGAQALAAASFGGLALVPRRYPVTTGSARRGHRTYFHWGLWEVPASYLTVRSLLATGVQDARAVQARGVFAAFRAARLTGAKGKLSFAPTEACW